MRLWERLLEPEIIDFIRKNEGADVAALALKKPPAGWPWPLVLDQIKARQKAKARLPGWHAAQGIVFPPPALMEQASSEATARYKASLVSGESFADLTAGTGSDFASFLSKFKNGIAVEKDETAAQLLNRNLKILGGGNFEIKNAEAETVLHDLPPLDFIYLDPQRRNDAQKGKFLLEDCEPNILELLPLLRSKAGTIMIKTSPVLDIDAALKALETVASVHVVEWRGECRETLYILKKNAATDIPITAVSIDDSGAALKIITFTRAQESAAIAPLTPPEQYLFEPSPAFQKAGAFKFIAAHYGLGKLHRDTHLYTAAAPCPGFPGRSFEIRGIHSPGDKNLPFSKANITLRNFPGTSENLRKKLKIGDGGDDYVFACGLEDGRKVLIHARKLR